jgi:hypothetical protein
MPTEEPTPEESKLFLEIDTVQTEKDLEKLIKKINTTAKSYKSQILQKAQLRKQAMLEQEKIRLQGLGLNKLS